MKKTWYYVHKGMLSTVAVTCVCELFPVLLVAHWIACGGAHGAKVAVDLKNYDKRNTLAADQNEPG